MAADWSHPTHPHAESRVERRDFLGRALAGLAGLVLLGRPDRANAETAASPQPFVGEVRLFGGNFAPSGWAMCNGQLLDPTTSPDLFAVIATTYGGNGTTSFAVPDLRGRAPLQPGQGPGLQSRSLGEVGGVESHALSASQLPSHTHAMRAGSANGDSDSPAGRVLARIPAAIPQYGSTADHDLAATAIAASGGGQAHNNMQPYLTVTYIIALQGVTTTSTDPPYIGEIRMFAGSAAPSAWMFCLGQQLLNADYDAFYQLIGTTYGGDGLTTFNLPDLRGRIPMHVGQGFIQGQVAGVEQVTLTLAQIPAHTHAAGASSLAGSSDDPAGRVPARNAAGIPQYGPTSDTSLAAAAVLASGGSGAHPNMQPYLGINFIISLDGVFPSQT
jgi:microcystin-dependent protein